MNILKSLTCTLIIGFAAAALVALGVNVLYSGEVRWWSPDVWLTKGLAGVNWWSLTVWLHVLFGVLWVGLLYYFNFVQIPAVAAAGADTGGPGAAAINQYVAPRALFWFRWAALLTWLTGASALELMPGVSLVQAFLLSGGPAVKIIGIGAWLGTIMLFNVWVLIWPNQKKILGIVPASDEEKGRARVMALNASRTNTFLSIPMLMCMVGYGHGLPYML